MSKKIRVAAMSDLHGHLPKDIPVCDVLCICGDIVPLDCQADTVKSISWFLLDFVPWADSAPCDKVIFIGGNHDFFLHDMVCRSQDRLNPICDADKLMTRLLVGSHRSKHKKLVYLMDNSYEYCGKRFYGTPWIADLSRWAFYASNEDRKTKFNNIPKHCDVLLTHMPPISNDCGLVKQTGTFNYLTNYGDAILADIIKERDIKWSLSGHVHSGEHISKEIDGTNFVNVSLKDEDYKVKYPIFEFMV